MNFGDILRPIVELPNNIGLLIMYIGQEITGDLIFTAIGIRDDDGDWAGRVLGVSIDDWEVV